MLDFSNIVYSLLPTALVSLILLKRDRFKPDNGLLENQNWKGVDVLFIVVCNSIIQITALILGKYNIVSFYHLFLYGNLILIIILGGMTLGIIRFKYKSKYDSLGLSCVNILHKVGIGIAFFFIYAAITAALLIILNAEDLLYKRAHLFFNIKLNRWPPMHLAIYIFGLVIIAPFFEECVFRGFMYGPFLRKIGKIGSVVFTSILWSLSHLQVKAFLSIFVIGILLCYLYKKTESLIPGIIMHSMINISNLLIYTYLLIYGKNV